MADRFGAASQGRLPRITSVPSALIHNDHRSRGELALVLLSSVVLGLATLAGGGTEPGLDGDFVVQLAALPLFFLAIWQLTEKQTSPILRAAFVWLILLGLLFVLQCVPLPVSVWTALGERAQIAHEMTNAGLALVARPLSLDPYATERMARTLLAPAAIFLAAVALKTESRVALLRVVFVMAAASAILGFAQVTEGSESALRFYAVTNSTEAVGFFANRNHFAALLYMILPLAIAWFGAQLAQRREGRGVPMLAVISTGMLTIMLIMGLVLARSRAGLVLGMIGALGGVATVASVTWHAQANLRVTRVVTVIALVGGLIAVQLGLFGVLERLQEDPVDYSRWAWLLGSLEAAKHFGPWGAGFGTFVNAYQNFESPAAIGQFYANHAHNDWVEVWLEGGVPAACLVLLLLAWLAVGITRAWYRRGSSILATAVRRAASVSILLLLAHEFVDYSLRTSTILCLFALMCALLVSNNEMRRSS